MGLLSYTKTLVALAPENVGDLNEILANIRAWANGQVDSENIRPGSITGDRVSEQTLGGSRMSSGMLNEGRIVANDILEERMLAPALRSTLVRAGSGDVRGNRLTSGIADLAFQVSTGAFAGVVDHGLGVAPLAVVASVIGGQNVYEGTAAVKISAWAPTGFNADVAPLGISPVGGDVVRIAWIAIAEV